MAEQYQNLSPVTKSAEDVKPSEARKQAEKAGGSGSAKSSQGSDKNDKNRAHPKQGRSLDYVTGPGAEAYTDGMYESDRCNVLGHFNRYRISPSDSRVAGADDSMPCQGSP